MGQNARQGRAERALISIDGMLLVVALFVMLVCIGAFIRITTEPHALRQQHGLLALNTADDLLAFEDFSFGGGEWSPATTSERLTGLGPVLGPFTDEPVERSFRLPIDTQSVRVSFDIHLLGGWSERDVLRVSLDGSETVAITLGARNGDQIPTDAAVPEGADIDVLVDQTLISPRPAEPALPTATEEAIVTLHIALQTAPAADILLLGLASDPSEGASWTLDNLAVVATTDGEI
ncbi:hypothetical protein [Gymnodinialimonas hymeniacidonis]|uniref:hypothetical protein n=1 Tax=Gymnodinialimonas hymeniacidonis TaxID=3126508 RepID=UPI0034C6CA3F